MAKNKSQQAAIAISMKKAGKKPKSLTKAQKGITVKPTADSTAYYKKEIAGYDNLIKSEPKTAMGKSNTSVYLDFKSKANDNLNRQYLKGKPGYDKNGFPIKKSTTKKKN
jgi:hypothetical protein